MKSAPHRLNPWPVAIIGWFGLCIPAAVAWVVFASSQRTDLVRPDYYEQDLRYQQQIDRLTRTQEFAGRVSVRYDAGARRVTLAIPPEHAAQAVSGRIEFYRPSDARLDFETPLAVRADGLQHLDARTLPAGLWKVRVEWQVAGEEFFFEQALIVEPAVSNKSESRNPKSETSLKSEARNEGNCAFRDWNFGFASPFALRPSLLA